MKIVHGGTRMVFMFSTIVIKIPKIRIFRMIKLSLSYTKNGQFKEKRDKIGNSNKKAIIEYLTWGFRANQIEARYSKLHPNSQSVENVRSYFFHTVLIQRRGAELNDTYAAWQSLLKKLITANIQDVDGLKCTNFCMFKDKIKLIDYGSSKTVEILNESLEKIINNHF